MMKLSEQTVEILRKVVENELQSVSDIEASYLKIELFFANNKSLDIIEKYICKYIYELLKSQILTSKYYNALESTLLLLEDVKSSTSRDRELYTISFLNRSKKAISTINAVYHMLVYEAENRYDFDILNSELLLKVFHPSDLDLVREIISQL